LARIAIGPYGGGSGISTYALELCKALSTLRTGFEVTLLAWQGFSPPDGEFHILSLPKNAFLGMSDYFGGPLVKIMGASQVVRRKVKDFDLVHFPDSTYGAFVRHPRLLLTIWGYYSWRSYPRWYVERFGFPINIPGTIAGFQFMAMNTLALRTAKVIVSPLPLQFLPKGQVRENMCYIPPPLSLLEDAASPSGSQYDFGIGTRHWDAVFILGSRDLSIRGKGAQLAIDAFTKLLFHDGIRALLIMVGENKDTLSVPNIVRDSVTFTGFLDRSDYLKLLVPGRCFLALSHGEELDYACLEAMAAGCAVIASDIPAHYVVKNHETGRVVRRNIDSVYSAMLELTDEGVRLKLGKNGARDVKRLTSPIEVARKYSTIYRRVLSA
jgi:glycosyltransferase involved in cell wall biosynthesis